MENVIEVKPIETKGVVEAANEAQATLVSVKSVEIKDQNSYNLVGDTLKVIKSRIKILDDKRKEITKPLDAAKKAVMDLFRKPLTMLAEAESILKRGMITYTDEQERKRQEREEKLRKQAAAEEKKKKDRLEERAKTAETKGNARKAEELREQKEEVKVDAPVLAPMVETPKGVVYKDRWYAEIVDKKLIPNEYLEPNMAMLNKVAQATKGKLAVAGVTFKSKKEVANRG